MAVYRGVVRGNRIELADGVELPDGAQVRVLVDDRAEAGQPPEAGPSAAVVTWERDPVEQAVLEDMLAAGLITKIPPPYRRHQASEPPPARIRGKSLARTVIEDRR